MQPPPLPNTPKRCRKRWLALAFILAPFLLIPLGLLSFLRLGADARTLRNSLMKATAQQWHEQIELSVGPASTALARAVLHHFDLPLEAQAALAAVDRVDLGLYQLNRNTVRTDRTLLLRQADQAMAARGWERTLAVVQDHQFVAAYLPSKPPPGNSLRLCLTVQEHNQLVVIAIRGNPEPLLQLALNQCRESIHRRSGR